jgi:hypothetical protein
MVRLVSAGIGSGKVQSIGSSSTVMVVVKKRERPLGARPLNTFRTFPILLYKL